MKWGNNAEGQVTKALEIVHSDVYSPTKYTSVEGANHFGTFVYVFLKNVWVYMMKSKESGFEKFEWFWAFVETQLEYELKTFWWMNRGDSILRDFGETRYCEHASRH